MKSVVTKLFGTLVLAASIGWMTGCDIPEEKKSVFQRAHSAETDSARPTEQKAEKQDQRHAKPRAFSVRDRVDI